MYINQNILILLTFAIDFTFEQKWQYFQCMARWKNCSSQLHQSGKHINKQNITSQEIISTLKGKLYYPQSISIHEIYYTSILEGVMLIRQLFHKIYCTVYFIVDQNSPLKAKWKLVVLFFYFFLSPQFIYKTLHMA